MLLVSSFMFIQCTSDVVVGPQGEAGIDGTNGTNGTNGTDGTNGTNGLGAEACVACHSESHRTPINDSYALSGHSNQTIMYTGQTVAEYTNGVSASCTECHTNEGYINYVTGQPAAQADTPTAVSCTTCHDKHSTFDFENDGHDFALRSFGEVEMRLVGTGYTIDYGDKSNNCIECHQPRKIALNDDDSDGLITVPNRYGPHYGAQSILLEGIYGVEIAGSTDYPTAVSATHRTGASCVSCHMGESSDGTDGLHSMVPTINSCTTCHGDAETLTTNLQAEVDGLMTELEVLFTAQGLLDVDGNLVHSVDYPKVVADAYWNYKFIYYDHSHGVHNPAYTRALLKNSIEALEAL